MIKYTNGLGEVRYQPSLPDGSSLWVSQFNSYGHWQQRIGDPYTTPRLVHKREAKRIERDRLQYLARGDWRRVE